MGEITDVLDSLEVCSTSSNGAISVEVKGQTATRVFFRNGARDEYDELALAESIEETVETAWASMKDKVAEELAQRGVASEPPEPTPEQEILLEEMYHRLESIVGEATSPRGYVKANVIAQGSLYIVFHGNAVRRTTLSTETLEMEVNEAIRKARSKWNRELRNEYQKYRSELINS